MTLEIGFFVAALLLVTCIAVFKARWDKLVKRPWRFTIRDILIATALLAAILGVIAYAMNAPETDGRFGIKGGGWTEYQLKRINGNQSDEKLRDSN